VLSIVCSQGTAWLLLDRYLWNFILRIFYLTLEKTLGLSRMQITGTSSAHIYDCVSLDSAWAEKSFRRNEYAHSMLDAFIFSP
jgi:hypothetical protein